MSSIKFTALSVMSMKPVPRVSMCKVALAISSGLASTIGGHSSRHGVRLSSAAVQLLRMRSLRTVPSISTRRRQVSSMNSRARVISFGRRQFDRHIAALARKRRRQIRGRSRRRRLFQGGNFLLQRCNFIPASEQFLLSVHPGIDILLYAFDTAVVDARSIGTV